MAETFETLDKWTRYAIDEIKATYGDDVSVSQKKKSLLKFGRTTNADADVKTTVALFQGTEVNETFATGNTIDYLVSDNAADTGDVTVEGHTLLVGDLSFATQTVTLTGTTPVALTTPLARTNRLFNAEVGSFASPATALVGNVYAYDSTVATGVTSGVPDVATATKCVIAAGKQQSEKCATSVSAQDYWLITQIAAGGAKGNANTVSGNVDVAVRTDGGPWRPLGLELVLRAGGDQKAFAHFAPYLIVPKNSDVRLEVISNTNDSEFSGFIHGMLAKVV